MDFLSYGLNQTCTHWAVLSVDGYNNPVFAAPTQLTCRWEDRVEKIQNDEGHEYVSRSRIFLQDDVDTGDYIALGVKAEADPRELREAFRIMAFRKTPSIDGEFFERKCYL